MSDLKRYMIIVIGKSSGIDKDLTNIADKENGIDFVDTKVLFMGTFYSPYDTTYIHEKLAHRPAFLLFDITESDSYGINLPYKFYTGIFPEVKDFLDKTITPEKMSSGMSKAKPKGVSKAKSVEEYTTVNEILDKLSRNDYNRDCLTDNEIKILDSQK
tara:strand:+ start:50 stop:523 length:474 start_codon:yes stop_codon:yes gene_type:complete